VKLIIKTIIVLGVVFGAIYLSANYLLKEAARKVVSELRPKLEQKGVVIQHLDYNAIRITSYNALKVNDIDLDFFLNKSLYGKDAYEAFFSAGALKIRFANLREPSFFFTLEDVSLLIDPEETNSKRTFGKMEDVFLNSRLPIYLKSPEASVRDLIAELKQLFTNNRTPLDLEIHATTVLIIDDKELKVKLFTVREHDTTYLKFDHNDILQAAKKFDLDLTEAEAEIIANYPSKVPAMIKITRDAKRLSQNEKSKNSNFPEDAYRHVYWSYHLTKAFGPELAKQITDAHETAPENTRSERLMDFHNNGIGRQFASESLTAEEIKNRVIQAKEIVRSPEEIG
jgi:hypothetical protein